MMFQQFNPLYALSGLAVGMLVGLTGVGGGSLMTPMLILVFGIHPGTAVGTDLLYAAATKSVGSAVHGFKDTIDWGVVSRLAVGSVPATILSSLLLPFVGKAPSLITTTLGVALLVTAVAMLFRETIRRLASGHIRELTQTETTIATVILGVVLGALVTLTSVGAGAIGMTVLLTLYPNLPAKRLVGSDIAHAVPLTLIAGVGHWMNGSVNWSLLSSLLVGSIPGIIIGSLLAAQMSDRVLRPTMAVVLGLVGAKMLT